MEINEAIEKLRAQKDMEGTPGFMIYKLLETAHPVVREVIEYQAAHALMAGEKVAHALDEAGKTEEGRAFLEKKFSDLVAKKNTVNSFDKDKEEDEDV